MTVRESTVARQNQALAAPIAPPHGPLGLWRRWRASRQRVLPAFLIIGTQKGGTTSLYRWLGQHPQVVEATRKEVHYFDINYSKGERWYRGHFPHAAELEARQITGEGSPYYMCHPHAPARIARLLPNVRLIALLRDPVERAISHYFHSQRNGREPLPIEAAMEQEDARINGEYARMQEDGRYISRAHRWYSYKARGRYVEQLRLALQVFPAEQLLIVRSEDLFQQPQRIFDAACAHIGIRTGFCPPNLEAQLVGGYDQQQGEPVRDSLRRYFAPHNAALSEFLRRDFRWT